MTACHIMTDAPGRDLSDEVCTLMLARHGRTLRKLSLKYVAFYFPGDGVDQPQADDCEVDVPDLYFDLRWFSLRELSALETLSISSMYLSVDSFAQIAALPRLKFLDLSSTNFTASTAALLFPALVGLRTLNISCCFDLTDVQKIPLPPQLQKLNVSSTRYFDGSMAPVDDLECTALVAPESYSAPTTLLAAGCKLMHFDSILWHAAGIQELCLTRSSIHNPVSFCRLLQRAKELVAVDFSGVSHTGDDVFNAISRLTRLRKLNLSMVRSLSARNCSAISLLTSLEELDLRRTATTKDCLSRLASGPCRKSLRKMDVTHCPLFCEQEGDFDACHDLVAESFDASCVVLWPPRSCRREDLYGSIPEYWTGPDLL